MTQPLEIPNPPSDNFQLIQCSFCLREIAAGTISNPDANYVKCPNCGYKQSLKKMPRIKDVVIFGSIIFGVYITTIGALIIIK